MNEFQSNGAGKSVGRYLMPEMVAVVNASICLAVVLSKSPKAKELFVVFLFRSVAVLQSFGAECQ